MSLYGTKSCIYKYKFLNVEMWYYYTPRRSRIPGLNGSPNTSAQLACLTRVELWASPGTYAPDF